MLFSCKCLNVKLHAPAATPSDRNSAGDGNSADDQLDSAARSNGSRPSLTRRTSEDLLFLKKALGPFASRSVSVHTQQADLLRTVPSVGRSAGVQWHLTRCIGCDCCTHASSASGDQLLINAELLTNDEDIRHLQATSNYSPCFGVLLNQYSSDRIDRSPADDATGDQTAAVRQLTQHFHAAVQREIEATDERICTFTEQQFAALQAFRERAHGDLEALARLARNAPPVPLDGPPKAGGANVATVRMSGVGAPGKPLLDTPPATPDAHTPMSIGNSPSFGRPPSQPSSAVGSMRSVTSLLASSLARAQQQPPSKPAETVVVEQAIDAFLFEMDDDPSASTRGERHFHPMITHSNSYMSDVDESDSDDSGEQAPGEAGLRIPGRPSAGMPNYAHSMPIAMQPRNGSAGIKSVCEPHGEAAAIDAPAGGKRNEQQRVDIAASIKALARSVHGDAVFGDLPRPRFSTQI